MNSELLVVLLIMAITALIVFLAAIIALRWLVRRGWKNKSAAVSPFGIGILFCAAGLVICFLYALYCEPFVLDVTHISLQSSKLPAGSKGFRIAHLTDLHSDPQVRLEEMLPIAVEREKPDLIVITGDCVNSPEGLPVFKKFLLETSKIAPTFIVKGNWDAWFWNKLDLFGGSSAAELNGDVREIVVRGIPVSIAGFAVEKEHGTAPECGVANVSTALKTATSKGNFAIVLYHYPDLIEEVSKENIDLYFAGHTHGGQVRLPFYGALVTLSKFGKKYEAGLYHVGNTALYVSRGIGMEGSIAPRIRFLCRPELAIIDVVPVENKR